MRNIIRAPVVNDVSLQVRAGEIVGLAGLVGAGRTEIVRAIAGADVPQSGAVLIDGAIARIREPFDAIRAGIALITEDRKAQGLVLGMTVRENITLAHLAQFLNREHFIDRGKEEAISEKFIEELRAFY